MDEIELTAALEYANRFINDFDKTFHQKIDSESVVSEVDYLEIKFRTEIMKKLPGMVERMMNNLRAVNSLQREVTSYQNNYCRLLAEAETYMSRYEAIVHTTLELPKFNGDRDSWLKFYHIFTFNVHENISITNGDKLSYLRSCLEGEAASLIKGQNIYIDAWKCLCERYTNPCEAAQSDVPVTQTDSKLEEFVKKAEQLMSFVHNDVNSDSCQDFVMKLLLSKLDNDTLLKWENFAEHETISRPKKFLSFLKSLYIQPLEKNTVNTRMRNK